MFRCAGRVSIISSTDNVADARLHRLTNALIKSGIPVEIWALGDSSDAPAGAIFHPAPGGKNFYARVWRNLILPFKAQGEVVIAVAPDLLVTSWAISRLRGQKIVADVHENYLQLLRDRAWANGVLGAIGKSVARLATNIAAHCDLTIVADVQVPPFSARTRIVVRNLPDHSLLTPSGELDLQPRAIYIGDLRKSRGLNMMIDIAKLCPEWKFDFIGNLADPITEFPSSITFHGRLAPKDAWTFAKGAWVGLTLLESTPAFLDAVPSKLYEYMCSGLAIISTPLPRCIALIEKSQSGVIASSAQEVADQLALWVADPSTLMAARANGLQWSAQNLDSEAEYGAFVSGVKSLIK